MLNGILRAEKDEILQQQVTEVMEQFERDTELIFRKFYQKCDQSGYHIERDQFMSLVTERWERMVMFLTLCHHRMLWNIHFWSISISFTIFRMGKAFDEFRSELEDRETKQDRDIQNLNENFRKEVTELTEATKMLINEKEKFDPMHSERRQKFFEFLEQCTSNIFNTNDMAAKAQLSPTASTSSVAGAAAVATCTHKLSKSERRQMLAAAKKQQRGKGKGAKLTVTRVVEETNGVRRQMIITKHKSTTISISGVFESRKSTCDDNTADADADADIDDDGVRNQTGSKVQIKPGKFRFAQQTTTSFTYQIIIIVKGFLWV